MKKSAPLLLLLSLLTLFSCEQDLYEKGDNEYSYMRADFVEAVVGSDKQVVYVVTDNDERLLLTAPYTDSWIGRSDTVYRAILYYSNQDDRAKVELSPLRPTPCPLALGRRNWLTPWDWKPPGSASIRNI